MQSASVLETLNKILGFRIKYSLELLSFVILRFQTLIRLSCSFQWTLVLDGERFSIQNPSFKCLGKTQVCLLSGNKQTLSETLSIVNCWC